MNKLFITILLYAVISLYPSFKSGAKEVLKDLILGICSLIKIIVKASMYVYKRICK